MQNINHVSIEEYYDTGYCWINRSGLLTSFAIFEESGDGYIPSFISFKCIPVDGELKGPPLYVSHLNAFRVGHSVTNLMSFGFNSDNLQNNNIEFKVPNLKSSVYFVIARINQGNNKSTIVEFKSIVDTGINFKYFLLLSEEKRFKLGMSYIAN